MTRKSHTMTAERLYGVLQYREDYPDDTYNKLWLDPALTVNAQDCKHEIGQLDRGVVFTIYGSEPGPLHGSEMVIDGVTYTLEYKP